MRLIEVIIRETARQQGHLFPWAPVLYALGIGVYFALRTEPGAAEWRWMGVALGALACLLFLTKGAFRTGIIAVLLALAGFAVAGAKANRVAEQTLSFRFYGAIEGRIIRVDRSASDAVRLTLDRVRLQDIPTDRTPARVRVSLHGQQGFLAPEPGVTVILTGHLSPPGGAVEPGGYDFRRQAWFQRLGGVGYTRTPVLALAPHDGRAIELWIYRFRMKLSQAVQTALPGSTGAFASAITTGDRSGIAEADYDALRASNLAHLLAISGLHMGLLTGFVFAAIRLALALVPRISLYLPAKKLAAAGALLAGAGYLMLSGGNVATERAFIMVSVMFGAVFADRRAVTLRAVAVAALIVLTLKPEALYGPGFQMSFAATTALVAVYGAFRTHGLSPNRWPRWMRVIGGVAMSSLVAGLATAPIGAAHFNQVPHYGLVANVVSVPLMGLVIIPAAVLAAVLAPFGLHWVGLMVMAPAIRWILGVAETVAGWDGAVSHVAAPQPFVLPILGCAALWLVLWQGWFRVAALPVAAIALMLWATTDRPPLLVTGTGGLVGLMTDQGRALSKAKGDGFAAESWLENDGDFVLQTVAAARPAYEVTGRQRDMWLGDHRIRHATGKTAAQDAVANCEAVDMLIVNVAVDAPEECNLYDLRRLRRTGALAVFSGPTGLTVITANEKRGSRLWSP
ncbi:MAG: ComEC/Rec2 family competence protein [Pseudomonadota bacterium]